MITIMPEVMEEFHLLKIGLGYLSYYSGDVMVGNDFVRISKEN